jgi:hypothetical protein
MGTLARSQKSVNNCKEKIYADLAGYFAARLIARKRRDVRKGGGKPPHSI